MTKIQYSYSGVFIPAFIWENPELSAVDKIVWATISTLHDGSRVCFASDQEIASAVRESEMLVTTAILRLEKLTLIRISENVVDGTTYRLLCPCSVEPVYLQAQSEKPDDASTADVQKIVDIYNDTCRTMPRAEKLTPARVRRVRVLLRDTKFSTTPEEYFKALFTRAHASEFLSGRSQRWSGCNIDWIIAKSNLDKILEGVYDNRTVAPARIIPENMR
jgi:hypothetical protein